MVASPHGYISLIPVSLFHIFHQMKKYLFLYFDFHLLKCIFGELLQNKLKQFTKQI